MDNRDIQKISDRLRGIDSETEQERARRQYLRSFADPRELGRLMRDRAVSGIRRNFEEPVEITDARTGQVFALEMIGDLEAPEPPDPYDYAGIYKKMMRGGTWSLPVKARFRIVEKDSEGNVVEVHDENKKPITVAQIPMPVYDRGFLVKGKKRHLANQFRRRPGVFTIRDQKGDVVTEFNVDPQSESNVSNFRFSLDDTGTEGPEFRMVYGTAKKIPAWDVAKLMGATDRELQNAVDKDTASSLMEKATPERYGRTVKQLHRSITGDSERSRDPNVDLAELEEEVREQLGSTRFDPHIMKLTMGSEDEVLNKDLMLRSFKKMQRVANEEIDPDDRESLSLKRVMAPYDLVSESVGRDVEVKKFRSMLEGNLRAARAAARDPNPSRKPRITQVLGNKLNPKIESKLTTSMLQRSDTSTNPLLWWADSSLTTVMGEGGIGADYAVPLDAKLINGSHVGYLDLSFTPESSKAGVNLHIAGKSRIVPDDRPDPSGPETGASKIVSPFLKKDGSEVELSPDELKDKTVALWDQYDRDDSGIRFKSDVVRATRNGNPVEVRASDVDYIMPDYLNAFNPSAALIPFTNSTQGNRIQYGAKQTQAGVPLLNREEPLVQVKLPGSDLTLEDILGEEAGAVRAKFDGTVEDIEEGGPGERFLVLKPQKSRETVRIPLPKDIPMGGHTPFDAKPLLQKGASFKKGDVLADSTFTKNGKLALGTNLRVAYMPWLSDTHEDAVAISERAAQKMTSEHLYHVANESKRQRVGTQEYERVGGTPLTREEVDALDALGIVKPGTKVKPGQTLMVGARNVEMDDEQLQAAIANLGVFGKKKTDLTKSKRPLQLMWNEPYEGEVVDVEPVYAGSKKRGQVVGAHITVRTAEPMQAGDKLFGRHGNKGVVSRVLPQDQMPKIKGKVEITKAAGPFVVGQEITTEEFEAAKKKYPQLDAEDATIDLLLNPLGVPSRMNPSQNHETDLGRVARQTGSIQKVEAFAYDDNWEEVEKRMQEAGVPDREVILDPSTGMEIPDIGVGHQYILKAKQQVTKKNSARGIGQFRDNDLASRSGGGARALGELGVYGLLAQDAREFLRNAQLYSSEDRPEVWSAIRAGKPLGDLGVGVDDEAKAFKRFKNYLRAAGVEPEHLKHKSTYRMKPLTDKDVVHLSGIGVGPGQRRSSVIEDPTQTFDAKTGKARSGGLFDKEITYGNGSPYWTRFELEQRMPNPIYEGAIQDLLGISSDRFHNIMQGKEAVSVGSDTVHGAAAIETMLKTVDIDKEYDAAFETAKRETIPSKRSQAYRKLRSIQMLREQKMDPVDAFMRKQVLVVPQQLREYRIEADGEPVVGDLNVLYRDLGMANKELQEAKKLGQPPRARGQIEYGLYRTMRTLQQSQGSEPLSGDYQGVMGKLIGQTPGGAGNVKQSLFKTEVFQRRQAFSGGAVLAADDRLGMDEVGVPKSVMIGIGRDHIIGKWRRRHPGASPQEFQEFQDRLEKVQKRDLHDPEIDEMLHELADERDLIVKRDPVLHMYGIQSFKPRLTEQNSLGLNPLVFGGFNADSVIGDIWLRNNGELGVIDISEFPRTNLLRRRDGVEVYAVPSGLEVPTLIDGRVQYAEVTEFSIHPDCEEWAVELSDGQVIQMAATHSVAAASQTERRVEKIDARDSVGRWIPVCNELATKSFQPWDLPPELQEFWEPHPSVRWEQVVRAEPTGRCIEMYDIKVPGPYTFAMASGAIVWDSDGDVMGLFMPVTEEAQQEAKTKLRPSANLFNPSNGGLEFTLGHESVLGIAKATRDPRRQLQLSFNSLQEAEAAWKRGEIKIDDGVTISGKRTTTGREMFSSHLPGSVNFESLRDGGQIAPGELPVGVSKRGGNLSRTLEYLARTHTDSYGDTANRLRRFGQEMATYSGSSLIRDDLKPQFKQERREIETELSTAILGIQSNRKLTPVERRQQIGDVFASKIRQFNKKQEELWDSQLNRDRPASLVELVKSGARANENQLKQTLVAPIAVVDGRNQVVPTPIMRNYSEGMDARGFIATAHGARKGSAEKVLQVRDPGYLTKQIVNTSIDQVITETDCGTSDGIEINLNNGDAVRDLRGRVLTSRVAAGKHRFGDGHVLSGNDISSMQRELGDDSPLFVKVRSATRCKAASGICQKCAGYDPSGQPFKIGTNIGIIAAQALGERSTQLMLSGFHGGGVFDPDATSATNLYSQAERLFRMPSTMGGDKAVVADDDAVVKKVRENRSKGGWDIITEGDRNNFFVPRRFTAPWESKGAEDERPKAIPDFYAPGTRIQRGDVLSSGVANPKDILKATGDIGKVQDYLTDRIHNLFKKEGVLRNNVEVVVKSMTDVVEVDDPGGSALLPGQRIPLQQAERIRRDFPDLKYRPILRGVDVAPREKREDFMARLNFNNLRSVLQESAQIGAESNYHSHNPIPGLAVGRFFNRPEPGQKRTGAY